MDNIEKVRAKISMYDDEIIKKKLLEIGEKHDELISKVENKIVELRRTNQK